MTRSAVVVAALDIGEANALSQILTAAGQYLSQPHIQSSPQYAATRRYFEQIVAVFTAAGEKLAIQLSLEQMGLEQTSDKPMLVLGASDSAAQMLADQDLSQWLQLALEQARP